MCMCICVYACMCMTRMRVLSPLAVSGGMGGGGSLAAN